MSNWLFPIRKRFAFLTALLMIGACIGQQPGGCVAPPGVSFVPGSPEEMLANAVTALINSDSPESSARQLAFAISQIYQNYANADEARAAVDSIIAGAVKSPEDLNAYASACASLNGLTYLEKLDPTTKQKNARLLTEPPGCTVVYHVNGISTTFDDFAKNVNELDRVVQATLSGSFTDGCYNTSNIDSNIFGSCPTTGVLGAICNALGTVIDLAQAAEQLLTWALVGKTSVTGVGDATKIRLDIQRYVSNGKKVILVPHSQGNFFVRDALAQLGADDGTASSPFASIGVIMTGSPEITAFMPGRAGHVIKVSNCKDRVACFGEAESSLADIACVVSPNFPNGCSTDPATPCNLIFPMSYLCQHRFIEAYLAGAPKAAVANSLSTLNQRLSNPRECQNPDTDLSLTLSANPSTITAGQTSTITVTKSGGGLIYNCQWSPNVQADKVCSLTATAKPTQTTTYTMSTQDNYGHTASASVTITVNPTPTTNHPPMAQDQIVSVAFNTAKGITLSATDADGDLLTYSIVAQPSHGTLGSVSGASVTYTPTNGYSGSDTFMFRASDGAADSSVATISIAVGTVNQPPYAVNDCVSLDHNGTSDIYLLCFDPDNGPQPLTYTIISEPTHGILLGNPPLFTYIPTSGYAGPDLIEYKVNDGEDDSDIGRVTLWVRESQEHYLNWQAIGDVRDSFGEIGDILSLCQVGNELIAGGSFASISGISCNNIATWNGLAWQPLGEGMTSAVQALIEYQGELIAGGRFVSAGGVTCNNIARWDGNNWNSLGNGITEVNSAEIRALAIYQNELIVGGLFSTAGGVTCNGIARWNGSTWQSMGSGIGGPCSYWRCRVYALEIHNGELIVGGEFKQINGVSANGIARWNGTIWQPLGVGLGGFEPYAAALLSYGTDLIVSGPFDTAGDQPAKQVARWDGSSWHPMGAGLPGPIFIPYVAALQNHNDDLIAGGGFTTNYFVDFGPVPNRVARWNGSEWEPLGCGMINNTVYVAALASFNGDLIAGGNFVDAGGHPAHGIAKWGPVP